MKRANIISSLIVMVISVFFYYNTLGFKKLNTADVGPAAMPRLFSIILMVLGIILFTQSFLDKENRKAKKIEKIIFVLTGVFLMYVFLIPVLGFYSTTIFFILIMLFITKTKQITFYLFVPLFSCIFVFAFFEYFLTVPVPKGILF